ncbi:hypothetical protein [Variovorax paradoxus]|uniref:hypothetical protein n=1 Tax=Variovorax paradoxus TaxID=34073 RepID=UPI003D662200
MHNWNPVGGSTDAGLLPDLDSLTVRSRDLGRNHGRMAGGMQTLRDNIAEAKVGSWAETTECAASRTENLLGLTLQAARNAGCLGFRSKSRIRREVLVRRTLFPPAMTGIDARVDRTTPYSTIKSGKNRRRSCQNEIRPKGALWSVLQGSWWNHLGWQ